MVTNPFTGVTLNPEGSFYNPFTGHVPALADQKQPQPGGKFDMKGALSQYAMGMLMQQMQPKRNEVQLPQHNMGMRPFQGMQMPEPFLYQPQPMMRRN